MKKVLNVLLVGLLCIGLVVGCSGRENKSKEVSVQTEERSVNNDLQYEIVSEEVIKTSEKEGIEAHYLAELKNTGEQTIYFNNLDSSIDIEDSEGKLLSTRAYVFTRPSVVEPGESAYISENIVDAGEEGKGLVSENIGKALLHLNPIVTETIPVPQVEITEASLKVDTKIQVLGRLTSKENKELPIVHVIIPVRDDAEKLCALTIGQIENIKFEEKKGFEGMDFIGYSGDASLLRMDDAIVCGDRKMFGN